MSTKSKILKTSLPPKIYSQAFKRLFVSEFEQGLFTKVALQRRYLIHGNSCIPRWFKKYGKFNYQDKLSQGSTMEDPQSQRIKELEATRIGLGC